MMSITMKTKAFTAICLTFLLSFSCAFSRQVTAAEKKAREGLPGRRIGGGTRGECAVKRPEQLIALVPENNLVLTQQAYPSMLFHIPQTSKPMTMELVLQDDNYNLVYEKTLTKNGSEIKTDSGEIINLNLLDSASLRPLVTGKTYRWYLSIICNPNNRARDIVVDGWIKRVAVEPDFAKKIEQASLAERVNLYAKAGLWQDAITTLVELRYAQPGDSSLAASWTQLLKSEKLDTLAQESLLTMKILKD